MPAYRSSALEVQPNAFDIDRPSVSYRKDGVEHVIDRQFIAGCDGISRQSKVSAPGMVGRAVLLVVHLADAQVP